MQTQPPSSTAVPSACLKGWGPVIESLTARAVNRACNAIVLQVPPQLPLLVRMQHHRFQFLMPLLRPLPSFDQPQSITAFVSAMDGAGKLPKHLAALLVPALVRLGARCALQTEKGTVRVSVEQLKVGGRLRADMAGMNCRPLETLGWCVGEFHV